MLILILLFIQQLAQYLNDKIFINKQIKLCFVQLAKDKN